MSEPAPYPADRPRAALIRSRLVLQVADELVATPDWVAKQALVTLRAQGGGQEVRLWGSDSPDAAVAVARGEADVAIVNPASGLGPTLRAAGYDDPLPVAMVATVPSYDQMAFAVRSSWGLRSLRDLAAARPPLHLSLRAQRDHGVHRFVVDALAAVGVTLEDLEAWGGGVHYDAGLPHAAERWALVERGDRDAVFDEGVYNWGEEALRQGFVMLEVDQPALDRLEPLGYRRGVLSQGRFPSLPAHVTTLDFSGFGVVVRADADPGIVRAVCSALLARQARIPWQGGPELPLARMVSDSLDAPLGLPLHPAAATFWQ
jgi:hypothetical protein